MMVEAAVDPTPSQAIPTLMVGATSSNYANGGSESSGTQAQPPIEVSIGTPPASANGPMPWGIGAIPATHAPVAGRVPPDPHTYVTPNYTYTVDPRFPVYQPIPMEPRIELPEW